MRNKLKLYRITKNIPATSIADVIKKEKDKKPDEIFIEIHEYTPENSNQLGFN